MPECNENDLVYLDRKTFREWITPPFDTTCAPFSHLWTAWLKWIIPSTKSLGGESRIKVGGGHATHPLRRDIGDSVRAFVLGCGPSVDDLDLENLRVETVCILNTVILGYKDLPFTPSFYLLNDSTLSRDPEILRATARAERENSMTIVRSKNAGGNVYPKTGNSVTMCKDACAVAIDVLMDHGYAEIILLGLDFNYQGYSRGEMVRDESQHFKINGEDIYHGIAWKFPDMDGKRLALLQVSRQAEERGVKIWNASKASKCLIFEKTERFDHWRRRSPRIVPLQTARASAKAVPAGSREEWLLEDPLSV